MLTKPRLRVLPPSGLLLSLIVANLYPLGDCLYGTTVATASATRSERGDVFRFVAAPLQRQARNQSSGFFNSKNLIPFDNTFMG